MAERVVSPAPHEARDVRFKPMLIAAAGMVVAVAAVLGTAFWMFPHTTTDQYVARPIPNFAPPRLQPSPRADMDAFRAQQMRDLNGVYWIDRRAGTVHVPIAGAMRKLAAEGIPDWPAQNQARR